MCDLHVAFLARALLRSRTNLQRADSVVNYLIRRVIQTGLLATFWTVVGLATFFLLPKMAACMLVDAAAGPIYTHVSGLSLQKLSNVYSNDM